MGRSAATATPVAVIAVAATVVNKSLVIQASSAPREVIDGWRLWWRNDETAPM
jgi:hypothetical protein